MGTRQWAIAALGTFVLFGGTPAPACAQDTAGTTRMLFAPNARPLPKGEGYVGAYALTVPFVQVGVTNTVSLGVAVPVVPYLFVRGMGGPSYLPFVVSGKARVLHRPRTSVAAGAIHFSVAEGEHVGLAYVVSTTDLSDGSLSIGAGCTYLRTDRGHGCRPLVTVGGDHRVSRRVTLITENHVMPGQGALVMGGVRRTRGRLSTDFGAMIFVGSGTLPGLVINMAYRFGGS